MNQRIEVKLRDIYGSTKAYPANEQAERLARLANTKTLTYATLSHAAEMGFEVVVLADGRHWTEIN